MEIIKNIVIMITVVSIFSTILLNFIGENNPQREIVKIACGCLMIITIIVPFRAYSFEIENIIELYDKYEVTADIANEKALEIKLDIISTEIENKVFSEINVKCDIVLTEELQIDKVFIEKGQDTSQICEFLGIKLTQIEYIESR